MTPIFFIAGWLAAGDLGEELVAAGGWRIPQVLIMVRQLESPAVSVLMARSFGQLGETFPLFTVFVVI